MYTCSKPHIFGASSATTVASRPFPTQLDSHSPTSTIPHHVIIAPQVKENATWITQVLTRTTFPTHRKSGLPRKWRRTGGNGPSILPQHGTWSYSRPSNWLLTSCTSNECKRAKVKCIMIENNATCQRCTTMKSSCVVIPTAMQSAKDKEREKHKTRIDE